MAPGWPRSRRCRLRSALSATAVLGADLVPGQVKLQARVGAGRLLVATGSLPLVGALVDAEGSLTAATVTVQRLEVAPRPDGPRTVLHGSVQAARARTGG